MTPQSALDFIAVAAGIVVVLLVAAFGGVVVYRMATNDIDLSRLISEPNGDASTSRFQFLVFTFVIAISFFLIVAATHSFPGVPQGVLVLLGISGSSYLVSKGIQFSDDAGVEDRPPMVMITPQTACVGPKTPSIQFKAEVIRQTNQDVIWSLTSSLADPGKIDPSGSYTPPEAGADGTLTPGVVNVKATSKADGSLSDNAVVTVV
jgi:hypothetical protein